MGTFKLPKSRWRQAAFYFSMAAFSTFLINLIFVLWATIQKRDKFENGIGTLLDQNYSTIKIINTTVNVIINILSTILLAGSNYCMQCLMAPTRPEIDDAHARQSWLDIGILSVRNFWNKPWKKKIIKILLSFASLPLHLVSTSVNNYSISNTSAAEKNRAENTTTSAEWKSMYTGFLGYNVDQMSVAECIDAYGVAFQSSRGNLLLVSANKDWQNICARTRRITYHGEDPCDNHLTEIRGRPDNWRPLGTKVLECYSQKTDEHYKLFFSSILCWTVTAFNLVKAVLMLFVALGMGDEDPLMTIGDAVASFLQHRDETTVDMCLKSKDQFFAQHCSKGPVRYDLSPKQKSIVITPGQWTWCYSLFSVLFVACMIFLFVGLRPDNGSILRFGLGAVHTNNVLDLGQGSILTTILLVNVPQIVVSLMYFTYNSQYTRISLITEWDRFSNEAKSLRVSSTLEGAQRDTYFLQLPYRYSIPLLTFSGGVHWLTSQTFFLVNLEAYAPSDNATSTERVTHEGLGVGVIAWGWSPLGALCVLVVLVLMWGFLIVSARRRLRFGVMPVAGSCSAAISAACHPESDGGKIWWETLRWGVVDSSAVGHCSFSSKPVSAPVRGQVYS
ncbi:hypothetical protein CMUS01_08354 [Colletotrichum musicola]|uniref:DUF6536 domain-containing protein n=1 Tax=Colletotrichum musicola TaxID=2175873 RepID=A0A8H6NDV0_9PEZI|nr:hypothetical protein CMUS01_08354 [Colletotrichum musicola]